MRRKRFHRKEWANRIDFTIFNEAARCDERMCSLSDRDSKFNRIRMERVNERSPRGVSVFEQRSSLFKSIFFALIKKISLSASEVDDFRASVAIFLLNRALLAKKGERGGGC